MGRSRALYAALARWRGWPRWSASCSKRRCGSFGLPAFAPMLGVVVLVWRLERCGEESMTRVCVLGLGYIGLPTASMFAVSGTTSLASIPTRGCRRRSLRSCPSRSRSSRRWSWPHWPRQAARPATRARRRVHHRRANAVRRAHRRADLRFVEQAARDIAPHFDAATWWSWIDRAARLRVTCWRRPGYVGPEPGRDFFVAHCPERVLPGRILLELVQNDRLAGG